MLRLGLLAFAGAGLLFGQPSPGPELKGVIYWPAVKLQGFSAALKAKEPAVHGDRRSMNAFDYLGHRGNYTALEGRRDESSVPEVHAGADDIFLIQDGEATMLYGGVVEGAPLVQKGAMRGARLAGAQSIRMKPGDVLIIPGDVPNQMIVEKGKWITFFTIKIESR
jgi:mannose-6-phosphate isomerase-like protein (cupin superfamily)